MLLLHGNAQEIRPSIHRQTLQLPDLCGATAGSHPFWFFSASPRSGAGLDYSCHQLSDGPKFHRLPFSSLSILKNCPTLEILRATCDLALTQNTALGKLDLRPKETNRVFRQQHGWWRQQRQQRTIHLDFGDRSWIHACSMRQRGCSPVAVSSAGRCSGLWGRHGCGRKFMSSVHGIRRPHCAYTSVCIEGEWNLTLVTLLSCLIETEKWCVPPNIHN